MVVKLITNEKNPQMWKKKNILSATDYKQTHQNEPYYPDMEKVKYCIEMHLLENHNRRKNNNEMQLYYTHVNTLWRRKISRRVRPKNSTFFVKRFHGECIMQQCQQQ